ncbi:PREDICTED: uncharacterized protein LOC104702222 [Camelina sativa]|uniref:Uncharacterized protein LOC104702222 n=1 Tax=Camelina sativa TaxID=90675 RepID=A0ABM0SUK1_CAMSA|nr:PREDICTED: uncharacterized protein LOC104702222 [Camelina sativa]
MGVLQEFKKAEKMTMSLLRIAIFNISYNRGLFPAKYFIDKSVPDMQIKKLMPMDSESRELIDLMDKGVYDALHRKYLEKLVFCICETVDGPIIDEYTFSFSYSDSCSQHVMMNINRTGDNIHQGAFTSTADSTRYQVKVAACKLVRTLVQMMETLGKIPEKRTIVMKLLYYDVPMIHQHFTGMGKRRRKRNILHDSDLSDDSEDFDLDNKDGKDDQIPSPRRSVTRANLSSELRTELDAKGKASITLEDAKTCLDPERADLMISAERVGDDFTLTANHGMMHLLWPLKKGTYASFVSTSDRIFSVSGWIRNQFNHHLCWDFSLCDLISITAVLRGQMAEYKPLVCVPRGR